MWNSVGRDLSADTSEMRRTESEYTLVGNIMTTTDHVTRMTFCKLIITDIESFHIFSPKGG
jgi:hypothetical protein